MKATIGSLSVSLLSAIASAAATPHDAASQGHASFIPRPVLRSQPLQPAKPFAKSPARDASKTCFVKPAGAGHDDAPAILKAFQKCNHGGTVVLDAAYTLGSTLDLTFLEAVDVAITGSVTLSTDLKYWSTESYKYAYQNASAAWRFGGKDVNIYGAGKGLIDGNGQAWYDGFAKDPMLQRPVLFVLEGLHGGSVTGLKMRNPPFWFNLIANSTDILVSDIDMVAETTSENDPKNSDGWDTYRSDNIVIQSSTVINDDDCVSFKPNSTNILVQKLNCRSHGISVGSLGQYPGHYDIVENIYVHDIVMTNSSAGARIKVWPNTFVPFQPSLTGGGGSGYVKNVTYDKFHGVNDDWSIEVNQCYGTRDMKLCYAHPSNVVLSDITFKNFWGTTSKKFDPKVGTIVCSDPSKCHNIQAIDIKVSPPSGKKAQWVCDNVARNLLQLDCIA
ncbi:hypothetical protein E4U42_002702 [Claviceps africana]|uniref:galacturonan 1,4-alpha-galacturonidase n=1 Tax=Claviceps africana TaxID=83212 RepID=A0A8K0NJD6_9HYPO|nr:hypothetical protein E4U42_002702 [Claviceps africana]